MPPPNLTPGRRVVTDDLRRLQVHLLLVCGGLLVVLALGLALDWNAVTRGRAEWPQIYPYTVAGAGALVVAMALLRRGGRAATAVALTLAGLTAILGAGTDIAVGVGLLPSSDPLTSPDASWVSELPAAAATATAVSVLLIPVARPLVARLRFWLAAGAGVISLLVILSYVYDSEKLILGLGRTGTSLPAAIVGILLVGASMCARPDQPPLQGLDRVYDRGLLRKILPMLVIAPFLPAIVHQVVSALEPDRASADAISQLVTVVILITVIVLMGGGQSRARRELTTQRQRVWDAFAHTPAGTAVISLDGTIVTANDALARLTGRHAASLVGTAAADLVSDLDRVKVAEALAEVAAGREGFRRDVRFRGPTGSSIWVDLNLAPVADVNGKVVYLILQCADLTDRKQLERVLAEQAVHDPLTGLLNREGLDQQVAVLRRAAREGRDVIVVFADVDDLKLINDTSGHSAGDDLLREVARRLRACTRDEDVVARVGGDEFVVVTSVPATGQAAAAAVVERLRRELSGPVTTDAGIVPLSVSLGASTLSAYPDTSEAIAQADRAMYADKRHRRRVTDLP